MPFYLRKRKKLTMNNECMDKKTKTWYDFDDANLKSNTDNAEKAVFRYVPFDILLQILNEEKLFLVKTSLWEDVYENFIFKEIVKRNGVKVDIKHTIDSLFGLCWTYKMYSDAMWRIYSPDKKSVRIKTRIGKIEQLGQGNPELGDPVCGRVLYYPQSKIERGIQALSTISEKDFLTLVMQSLFVKRKSFSHESEYRIISLVESSQETRAASVIGFPINPLDFIENIYFDPRADEAYVNRCTKILVDAFSYPASRIKKSNLYSFNQQTINYRK